MRSIQRLLYFLSVVLTFSSCRKEEFDAFYGRPDNLGAPIYQQLQERKNFTKFLECVDKAGYKQTLSSAGSWTIFAPNDEAFDAFMKEMNVSTIDDSLASKIARYSMIYDGEKTAKLTDFFSKSGFVQNNAFRRRTVYYDFVYSGKDTSGTSIKVVSANRNGSYLATDFNNKHIPYFFKSYMEFKELPASDYNFFYPNSPYTGLNVGPAAIDEANKDIVAENGIIHVVNKVLTPPATIEGYLSKNNDYSIFNSLLQKFVTYSVNVDISKRYQALSGSAENVYAKTYSGALGFSPNNENYFKLDANDAQQQMYSITAPTNAALEAYARKVLLKYYYKPDVNGKPKVKNLDELYQLRPDIIQDYVNAHLFTIPLWPSKFKTTPNALTELNTVSKIDLPNVVDKQSLSNGFFYGLNKSQEPSVFSTVYGRLNLDPDYNIMKQALIYFGMHLTLKLPSFKYAIVLTNDAQLGSLGYRYDPFFANPIIGDNVILKRWLQSHIIPLGNRNIDFMNGSGIIETFNGEFIKYDKGKLYSAGVEEGIAIDSVADPASVTNGQVLYANKVLNYSTQTLGKKIEQYASTAADPYYNFFMYLKNNALLYNATTGVIQGVTDGVNYTVLVPTNEAIVEAVKASLLPGNVTTGVPNFTPSDGIDVGKVTKFLQSHIINKNTIVSDGQRDGVVETLYKNSDGDAVKVTITENTTTSLKIQDITGRVASVVLTPGNKSNVLANRAVIHQINTYLKASF